MELKKLQCNHCGYTATTNSDDSSRCQSCHGEYQTLQRCIWCAKWSAESDYCNHCGAVVVAPEQLASAIALKVGGVSKMSLAVELDKLSDDEHKNNTQQYQPHFDAIDKIRVIVESCQEYLVSNRYIESIEKRLLKKVPFTAAKLASYNKLPSLDPAKLEQGLLELIDNSSLEILKQLASIVIVKLPVIQLDHVRARAIVDELCKLALAENALSEEAMVGLAGWQLGVEPFGTERLEGRLGRKIFSAAYVKLFAEDKKALVWIAVLCAKTEQYYKRGTHADVRARVSELLQTGMQSSDKNLRIACAMGLQDETLLAQVLDSGPDAVKPLVLKILAKGVSESIIPVIATLNSSRFLELFDLLTSHVDEKQISPAIMGALINELPNLDKLCAEKLINYISTDDGRLETYGDGLAKVVLAGGDSKLSNLLLTRFGDSGSRKAQLIVARSEVTIDLLPYIESIATQVPLEAKLADYVNSLARLIFNQEPNKKYYASLKYIYVNQIRSEAASSFILSQFLIENLFSTNPEKSNAVFALAGGKPKLFLAGKIGKRQSAFSKEFCENYFGTTDNFGSLLANILCNPEAYHGFDWAFENLVDNTKEFLTALSASENLSTRLFIALASIYKTKPAYRKRIAEFVCQTTVLNCITLEKTDKELLGFFAILSSNTALPKRTIIELLALLELNKEAEIFQHTRTILLNQCRLNKSYAYIVYDYLIKTASDYEAAQSADRAADLLTALQAQGISYTAPNNSIEFKLYDLLGININYFESTVQMCEHLERLFTSEITLKIEAWFIGLVLSDIKTLTKRFKRVPFAFGRMIAALSEAVSRKKFNNEIMLQAIQCIHNSFPALDCSPKVKQETANVILIATDAGKLTPISLSQIDMFSKALYKQFNRIGENQEHLITEGVDSKVTGGVKQDGSVSREVNEFAFEVSMRWLVKFQNALRTNKLDKLMPVLGIFHNHISDFQPIFDKKMSLLFETLDTLMDLLFRRSDSAEDCLTQRLLASEIISVMASDADVASYCISKLNSKISQSPKQLKDIRYARRIIEQLSNSMASIKKNIEDNAERGSQYSEKLYEQKWFATEYDKEVLAGVVNNLQMDFIKKQFSQSRVLEEVVKGVEYAHQGDYIKAVAWLKQALDKDGQELLYLMIGFIFIKHGLPDQAMKYTLEAIVRNPVSWKALVLHAYIHEKYKKDYKLAYELMRRAISIKPDSLEVILIFCSVCIALKKMTEAAKYVQEGIKLDTRQPRLYFFLGDILSHSERHEDAIKNYKRALELGYKNEEVYCAIGKTFSKLGDQESAINYYMKSVVKNERCIDANLHLGEIYLLGGSYHSAIKYIGRALEIEPGNYACMASLARAYKYQGEFHKAVELYSRVLKNSEHSFAIYQEAADACVHAGDYFSAQEYLEQAIIDSPADAQLYYDLAEVYEKTNSLGSAVGILQRAIDIKADYTEAIEKMARIYMGLDRFEQAYECYEKIIKTNKKHTGALSGLGQLCQIKGDMGMATSYFKQSLKIDKNDAKANCGCANTLFASNQYAESAKYYRKAIQISPEYVEAHIKLGHAYFQISDFDEAAKSYTKGAILDPTLEDLSTYLRNVVENISDASVRYEVRQILEKRIQ